MSIELLILEAIYGLCCNEAKSTSHIKTFICENFTRASYVKPSDMACLVPKIEETIKELKQAKMLISEYYMDDDFYLIASNKFANALEYTPGEEGLC